MLNLLLLIIAGALLFITPKLYLHSEAVRQLFGWTAAILVCAAFLAVLPLILLRAAVSGLFGGDWKRHAQPIRTVLQAFQRD